MIRKPKVLPPVLPNAGLTALYQKKLTQLIGDMTRSVLREVKAAYRANPPVMAQDLDPADALRKSMAGLSKEWKGKFDRAAKELAEFFALAASQRSDRAFRAILKRAGLSVEFKMTPAQIDIMKATVNQNVALIKSIPERYLSQVEGSVMRAVQIGMDVGGLTKELLAHYDVTKKRAAFISRDQNIKANSAFNRNRQIELGITQAQWKHSSAGKEPRPSHVKAGREGVVYDVNKGWFDPTEKRFIQPGELVNCRCTSRSVIPGFI